MQTTLSTPTIMINNYYLINSRSRSIYLTSKCEEFMERHQCKWLFEMILSWQHYPSVKVAEVQIWRIKRMLNKQCLISCFDNNQGLSIQKKINTLGCKFLHIEFICYNNIIMLPNEFTHIKGNLEKNRTTTFSS